MKDALNRIFHKNEEIETDSTYFFNNRSRKETDLMVIQLTLGGTAFIEAGRQRHLVNREEAMLFKYGDKSSYGYPPEADEPYHHRFITFVGNSIRPAFDELLEQFGPVVSIPKGNQSRRLFNALCQPFPNSLIRDRYEESARLYELIMVLLREQSENVQRVNPAIALHEHMQNYFQRPFSIKEFAVEIGISREALSRKFKDQYGMGPATLLRQLRMAHAHSLILSTSLSVAEVGLRCGYPDLNAFSRTYRNTFSESPRRSRGLYFRR